MNGWMESLALNLLRTTLVTGVAAWLAWMILPLLRSRGPRLHRLAWVLVLAQGWLIVPFTWRIEIEPPRDPATAATLHDATRPSAPRGRPAASPDAAATGLFREAPSIGRACLVAWVVGGAAVVAIGLTRYARLLASGKPGEACEEPEWVAEWRQARGGSPFRGGVELRITRRLGPLLTWAWDGYLVLAPRSLWLRLTHRDRLAILRHELAHCERGDLWKNLAVRLLAAPQWFNPLAWLAVQRFEEAGEWACDERAARAVGQSPTEYASTLLQVAGFATQTPCGAVGAAGGVLTRRVKRLLDRPNKEVRNMRGFILPVLLAGVGLAQAVRIERVEAEEPEAQTQALREAAEDGAIPRSRWNYVGHPYVIEPPDILLINITTFVPKKSHKIAAFDGLLVQAKGDDDEGEPISDVYTVDTEGEVDLGPSHGRIRVSGLTIDDAQRTISRHLARKNPAWRTTVSLGVAGGVQQVAGEHLVHPVGHIRLGAYGAVNVAGLEIEQAKQEIEKRLAEFLVDPEVRVDIFASNSKKFYIISRTPQGDSVITVPITGNETVLDAIASVGGVKRDTKVWIERGAQGVNQRRVMQVDFQAIAMRGDASTNYRLWPGDRLFIKWPVPPAEATTHAAGDERARPPIAGPQPVPDRFYDE